MLVGSLDFLIWNVPPITEDRRPPFLMGYALYFGLFVDR